MHELITAVVGGQYGSEGKGAVCQALAQGILGHDYGMTVRVGGPQAGHSTITAKGKIHKWQTIPVAAAFHDATPVIGMGAVIEPDVLRRELGWLYELCNGDPPQVKIDYRATVLSGVHVEEESRAKLTAKIGSTGHGVGAARADRIMRTAETAGEAISVAGTDWLGRIEITDTVGLVRDFLEADEGQLLIEGAQGQALSLFSGGYYPHATSSECGPMQMFADIGIPLVYGNQTEVYGVYRTFPIRVAGPSGFMRRETEWQALQEQYGDHIPTEHTTVTKRVRRVGLWDKALASETARYMAIDRAILTFLDYPLPKVPQEWSSDADGWVDAVTAATGVQVPLVGVGFGKYRRVTSEVGRGKTGDGPQRIRKVQETEGTQA